MKCIKLLTTICALSFLLGSCDSVNDSVSKKKEELSVDISTDKMEYGPETDKQVSVTIANHSAESIFLDPSARGPYNTYVAFQKQQDEEWVYIDTDWFIGDRSVDSYEIKPGETFGPDIILLGSLAERPGIYRLVYYLCPSKKGCEEYEAVSFSSRVSNSWKMDERDFIVSITTDKSGINLSEEKSDEIKVRIENDSEDESIFFNRALPIGYQRLVNGDWVTAGQISFDQSEFAGVYEVKPGSDFGPETLSLKGIVLQPGTYRFIYPFCSLGSACKREDQFLPVHLRVSNTVNVTQSDYQTEIFTDQTVVSLSEDDKIGVGIANNSDQAIFLNKSYYVGYQRYENGEWVTGELSWFTVDSFDDFYKIAPGEKHGGRGGNPFEFLPLKRLGNQTGAYRFIYQACRTNAECTEGDELPLALRVSNTWKVVE